MGGGGGEGVGGGGHDTQWDDVGQLQRGCGRSPLATCEPTEPTAAAALMKAKNQVRYGLLVSSSRGRWQSVPQRHLSN